MPTDPLILLVEDNEDDVFLMRRALKAAGILNPLQVLEDGMQAIAYLAGEGEYAERQKYPVPAVVFLDLKLPHKSGFDVLEWMRERRENPPVVVLSSSNSPNDEKRATALGAILCAIKPPAPHLFQTVADLIKTSWRKHTHG